MVAIIGGSPLIGGVLEILLRVAGHEVRFLGTPETDRLNEVLPNVRLMIVSPPLRSELREAVMVGVAAAGTPVLELVRAGDDAGGPRDNTVPWPCRMEDLDERIRATLRPASGGYA